MDEDGYEYVAQPRFGAHRLATNEVLLVISHPRHGKLLYSLSDARAQRLVELLALALARAYTHWFPSCDIAIARSITAAASAAVAKYADSPSSDTKKPLRILVSVMRPRLGWRRRHHAQHAARRS